MNVYTSRRNEKAAQYLVELGKQHPRIVAVNADMQDYNTGRFFVRNFPERAYDVGIAEQNLVSMSAGLAHTGLMPFVFAMTPFLTMRAAEQVRTDVVYGKLPVRLFGIGAGYGGGISGATHCALEDVALFTSFPGMTVVEVTDDEQLIKVMDQCVSWEGPMYIRIGNIIGEDAVYDHSGFQLGKATVVSGGDDGAFIVSGIVVGYAMEAAKRIKEETGADIRVVDVHTLKPVDKEAIVSAAETGRVVVAQDHNIMGGLGYIAAAVLQEAGVACKYKMLGCPDQYVPLATTPFLYKINEYDTDGLVKNMKAFL
ncbi:MAG: transketolase family protein [Christensenellales bacterium]